MFAADELTGVLNRSWQSTTGELAYAKTLLALWLPRGSTMATIDQHLAAQLPTPALTPLFVTQYRSKVSDGLIEDEVVHVFGGKYDGPVKPNAAEVSEWKWITFADLERDLRIRPEHYAVWFRHYLAERGEAIAKWLGR